MESDTKRINKYSDKPQKNTPNQIINPQQNNQQQGVPIIIQQQPYLQPNQIIIPQLQNSVTQPIIYQPIYNQPVIIKSGQPNSNVNNQAIPVPQRPEKFTKRRERMVCPYCNSFIRTNVELNFNFFRCCIFFSCIIFIICFAGVITDCDCRGNDCCCCCCCCCSKNTEGEGEGEEEDEVNGYCTCFDDATHTCPVCNQVLGESKTC
jgi:hypothetical protein